LSSRRHIATARVPGVPSARRASGCPHPQLLGSARAFPRHRAFPRPRAYRGGSKPALAGRPRRQGPVGPCPAPCACAYQVDTVLRSILVSPLVTRLPVRRLFKALKVSLAGAAGLFTQRAPLLPHMAAEPSVHPHSFPSPAIAFRAILRSP
jgi:hypothetical protein